MVTDLSYITTIITTMRKEVSGVDYYEQHYFCAKRHFSIAYEESIKIE